MESKQILFGAAALKRVQAGMDEVADAVKITLGPRGRNVILNANPKFEALTIINDGVRIAREINPEAGDFERTGASIIKKVAEKTNDVAGDGTTTATVLMQAIVKAGMQQLGNAADPVALRRGIEQAAAAVLANLSEQARPTKSIEALTAVATTSCGDPALGLIIAKVVHKLGIDGVITMEDSETEDTTYDFTDGLELRGGVQLPIFITDPARQLSQLDNVPIFVTDHDLTNGLEAMKIMELAGSKGHKEAVVIANSVSGEAMTTAVINRAQGKFTLIPIRVQAWGETGGDLLRDVAAVTGATFFGKQEGYKLPSSLQDNYEWDHFGHADRLIATKERTTIIGGGGDREARIKEIEAQIPNIKVAYRKEQVKERCARLKTGVGTISVGAIGETEREYIKLRVEDAINATKAALDAGIVTGGGAALFRAATKLRHADRDKANHDDTDVGRTVVINACEAPIRQMAINSSLELSSQELGKIAKYPKLTIDFTTGETVNGIESGIIDPILVVATALKNAASEAALFLTSGAAVVAREGDPVQQ